MSIYEYDEEKQRKFDRQEGYESGFEDGKEKGREEGENQLIALMEQMALNGDEGKILLIISDKNLRQKMYKKYERCIQVA